MDALDGSLPAGPSSRRESERSDQPRPFAGSTDGSYRRGAPGGGGDGPGSGSFDCNICLEVAQDPVVTLCGHLFCWPCLYRWLEVHSISKDCPVCKAVVVEDTVIPLYGRGKIGSADPRTKPIPGMSIPRRPSGQRRSNVRQVESQYQPHGLSFTDGHSNHSTTGSLGNLTFSTGFGLFPSLFGLRFHGLPDSGMFSGGPGSGYGVSTGLQRHNVYLSYSGRSDQQQEAFLHKMFIFLLCFVVVCLLFF